MSVPSRPERYLTVKQAAERLRVSTATLRRWSAPDFQSNHEVSLKIVRDPINNYRYFEVTSVEELAEKLPR